MAKHGKGRGWHGNSEGHAAVARRRNNRTSSSSTQAEKTSSVTVKSSSAHGEKNESESYSS
jgi:hypothetical protein